MNTKKGKNKHKQNKPPTPQPKQEVSEADPEKPEAEQVELKEKPESIKNEERVPEILSEIVQPVLEVKLSESEAPKKPKRNRGKKKKDKSDENDDFQDQNEEESILVESKIAIDTQEIKIADTTAEKSEETAEVTPAARKKKNKNKKHTEQAEKPSQEIKITPVQKDEELTDLKIITVVPVANETSDDSKSKKKNKKKKRTDSERSEKAEEIVSCTAAFQKLLTTESRDDKKKDQTQDDIKTEIGSSTSKDTQKDKAIVSLEGIAPVKESLKPDTNKREKSTENKKEGGKGKKKNKKDRKNQQKEESDDDFLKSEEPEIRDCSEVQKVVILADPKTPKGDITPEIISPEKSELNVETSLPVIEKEKSPKPKAKIAKPVEKKRKDKPHTVSSTDNLAEKTSELLPSKEKTELQADIKLATPEKKPALQESQENKPCDIGFPESEEIIRPLLVPDTTVTEVKPELAKQTEISHETEKIQIPVTGMGKKRKKSPKPQKNPASTSEITQHVIDSGSKDASVVCLESTISKPEKTDALASQETSAQAASPVPEIQTDTRESITNLSEPLQPAPKNEPISSSVELSSHLESTPVWKTSEIIQEQEIIKETTDPIQVKEEISIDKQVGRESINVPESSGKKRKKSPKPQKKPEKTADVVEPVATSTISTNKQEPIESKATEQTTTPGEDLKKDPIHTQEQMKSDSYTDLPILEDIEIRSVKAEESEGSVCDITPDVQYPRASSQQQDDNNNNMTIQEITSVEERKLHIPSTVLDTPLIQGSGETPLPRTEITPSGITITEMASPSTEKKAPSLKQDEKTDLKSKVLDVNQGMEELRRSIERSLAELSSMEKNEKDAEEQFAKAQAKLEAISDMAKKSDDKKAQTISSKTVKETKELAEEKEKFSESPVKMEIKRTEKQLTDAPKLIPDIQEKQSLPTASPENSAQTDTYTSQVPPVPARKDNKGKGKKKKGKQDIEITSATSTTAASSSSETTTRGDNTTSNTKTQDSKKEEQSKQKADNNNQEKGKQQSDSQKDDEQKAAFAEVDKSCLTDSVKNDFERIENFEDALFSSVDENEQDVNKTFEIIANEAVQIDPSQNPEINITAPVEDDENTANDRKKNEKVNPLSQPKNLIGHPDIPARLNRTDYKKEKNKNQTPNTKQATVKIKDAVPIEVTKESKESQTENKRRFLKDKTVTEAITSMTSENEEYVYKYSFRKVFLPNACHVCKKDLKLGRVPCSFCNLIFYCSVKHKDEDYSQHQGLCFAVSTIVHLKDQKHIYADAQNITGHEYRLLRMQMIVSCEKVLKRRLVPWEQEALLYPRICADVGCREWRQSKLIDCDGCGQVSYCSANPSHLPKTHQRWCKSYSLYSKLVVYQQSRGRLEPRLPTRVMAEVCQIPGKLNEVLANMYEEKIDMTDIQYAALTQIATAPLTALYCHQLYNNKMNTIYANGVLKKSSFTIHVVGAELQFEADALNKWEVFFLHLRPDVKDLRVVLIGPDLNPNKLPTDLLAKIKLCENCRLNKRRVLFDFQDKKTYHEYWSSEFTTPDLVCAFNPNIQRSSVFNGRDIWPATIKCILKLKVPLIITSYTMSELKKDLSRIKECSEVEVSVVSEADFNAFASVRPDRNFISDDEMPLLFKNYCFATVCGAF